MANNIELYYLFYIIVSLVRHNLFNVFVFAYACGCVREHGMCFILLIQIDDYDRAGFFSRMYYTYLLYSIYILLYVL